MFTLSLKIIYPLNILIWLLQIIYRILIFYWIQFVFMHVIQIPFLQGNGCRLSVGYHRETRLLKEKTFGLQ